MKTSLIITVGVSLIFFGLFYWVVKRGLETENWVATEGKLLNVHLESWGASVPHSFPPIFITVEYEYFVDGQQYLGNRISVFDSLPCPSVPYCEKKIDALKSKQIISVWYDEKNPKRSVIIQGVPISSALFSFLGFVLFALVALCLPRIGRFMYMVVTRHGMS